MTTGSFFCVMIKKGFAYKCQPAQRKNDIIKEKIKEVCVMDLRDIAKSTKELSDLLCISLEETWEEHTDDSIKKQYRFEDVKKAIEEGF